MYHHSEQYSPAVIPHVGMWIEIAQTVSSYKLIYVIPHVGMWIEIQT